MPGTLLEWVMLGAGVVIGCAGLFILVVGRREPIGGRVWVQLTRFSEPTRLVIGLVVIGVGYHLGVWALPRGVAAVQVPREYWVWVVLASVVMVALSLGLDRVESAGLDEKE